MSEFNQAILFIIYSIFGFASLAFSLRFLLRFIQADYYNPVSQLVLKLTRPIMDPLHRIIPVAHRIDVAALVMLVSCHLLKFTLIGLIFPSLNSTALIIFHALADSIEQFVDIYFWAILLSVLLSWVSPHQSTPLGPILHKITEPVLSRIRQIIPPMGGFDLSPIPALMALQVLKILIPG